MNSFYKNLGPVKYDRVASELKVEVINKDSIEIKFNSFRGLNNYSSNDLTFLYSDNEFEENCNLPKGVIISKHRDYLSNNSNIIKIYVDDVHYAVTKISNLFYRDFSAKEKSKMKKTIIKKQENISENSIIKNNCKIGKNFSIGDGSVINEGCIVGDNVKIGSNTIIQNTIIGDDVIIESNCSIGQSGFGFSIRNFANSFLYHIGRVIIQNNSYIGSNCTIDRGSFDDTYIGENVYLDNQVHIAHNVSIGSNSILAGQCGVAGSTKIGNSARVGGQVGIIGHIQIGDFVEIGAKSGVRNSIESNQKVMGDPAINMFTYLKKYKKNISN